LAADAQSALTDLASDRKDAAADFIRALAAAVQRGAEELEESGRQDSASLIRRASSDIEGFARTVQSREPGELVAQVQDFARRRPALVAGVAIAAGFAAMRFLMSSAKQPAAAGSTEASSTEETSTSQWR
jgi:hypothetical protein